MYIDDAADACVFLMNNYEGPGTINIGVGIDYSIAELVASICDTVGYYGEIRYDTSKPDGMPRRMFDSTKLQKLGFSPKTSLQHGLGKAYQWYLENIATVKA
jgi:GDP-L-fucose synthase